MYTFGKYALEALIGRGGMADVFRARVMSGPQRGRVVAVKRMRQKAAAERSLVDVFFNEADIGRYLKHPNIVQVLEGGMVDDIPYITMEYLDGANLARVLDVYDGRHKLLPIDVACYIVQLAALALHAAHGAVGPHGQPLGIVHCDVNPSNIIITRSGEVKLCDFGVAHTRLMGNAFEGAVAGKTHFLAPETIDGEQATPAADVFALGVTLYELLTMQRPFEGRNVRDITRRILRGKVQAPSMLRLNVKPALDEIVLRALEVNRLPGRLVNRRVRYGSAHEMAVALSRSWSPPLLGATMEMTARLRHLVRVPGLLAADLPRRQA